MALLNKYISNINNEIWDKSGSDTNNAEAAHSMVNREGKQLKLLSAILRLVMFLIVNYKIMSLILYINYN